MNEQLIKFIELCLLDGVITDKEREVIFRKSKELGVPDDECEIIVEGMILKYTKIQSKPNLVREPKSPINEEVIKINDIEQDEISDDRLRQIFSSKTLELIRKKKIEITELKRKIEDNPKKIEEVDKKIFLNETQFNLLQKEYSELVKIDSIIENCFKEKEFRDIQDNNLNFSFKNGQFELFKSKKNIFGTKKKGERVNLSFKKFFQLSYSKSEYFLEEKDINKFIKLNKIYVDLKKKNKPELQRIQKEISENDKELINLKRTRKNLNSPVEIDEIKKVENEIIGFEELIKTDNFILFKQLYQKSPILFQSNIFSRYLEVIEVNNDKEIMNLTRFNNFIINEEKKYSHIISRLFKKLDNSNLSQTDINNLINDKNKLKLFYNSFHIMYQSLVSKKMGVYMKIYVELETIGIFTTFFESTVMDNLNVINKHLDNLNSTLKNVSSQLSQVNNYLQLLNSSMYKLNLSVDETNLNLNDISSSIQNGNNLLEKSNDLLDGINSGVGLNNLLTGIQTYQMYKINNNTKSLRE